MTDEAKFVVACVRSTIHEVWDEKHRESLNEADAVRRDAGSGGSSLQSWSGDFASLSWDRVLEIAEGNAVTPLVAEALDRCDGNVPEPVRSRFRTVNRHNAARNLVLANAMHEVLDALEAAEVRAVPFKGPVLATTGYGKLSRRSFGDVDVLIPPERRPEAKSAVEELGYERSDPYRVPDIDRSPVLKRTLNEYAFYRSEDDTTIELRWAHDTPGVPSFETFWDRRTSRTVTGTDVPTLSAVDGVLTQTVHAAKHACRRLAWIADVAAATALLDDWDRFCEVVADRNLRYRVSIALRLAVDLFDAPVPDRVWASGPLPNCEDAAATAYDHWLASPVDTTTLMDEFRFDLRLFPPGKALRSIGDVVFRPRHDEYEALPLPPFAHPVYYVYRPLRLVWVYGPRP